jgi:hypothetical protein
MPHPSRSRRRKGVLPADPPIPPSPAQQQSQVLDVGSRECDPTTTSHNASIEELQLSGTLAPALRRVHAVVTRIQHRLSATSAASHTQPRSD